MSNVTLNHKLAAAIDHLRYGEISPGTLAAAGVNDAQELANRLVTELGAHGTEARLKAENVELAKEAQKLRAEIESLTTSLAAAEYEVKEMLAATAWFRKSPDYKPVGPHIVTQIVEHLQRDHEPSDKASFIERMPATMQKAIERAVVVEQKVDATIARAEQTGRRPPLYLMLLLHSFVSPDPIDNWDSPAAQGFARDMVDRNILEVHTRDFGNRPMMWKLTERGEAWLDMLLRTPYPVERTVTTWVDPRDPKA